MVDIDGCDYLHKHQIKYEFSASNMFLVITN